MAHFKEIWFDMDGTLAAITPAWEDAHDDFKYRLYATVLGSPSVTNEIKHDYETLYRTHKSNSAVFQSLGLAANYWMTNIATADLSKHYESRKDVLDTLQVLAKRANLGIFTNNTPAIIDKTLKQLQIPRSLFGKVLSADAAIARKPHPHGFEIMLDMAACQPTQLLYVGDRYDVDIEPVQKLGAKGALVWDEDPRANYSFLEFSELLTINS